MVPSQQSARPVLSADLPAVPLPLFIALVVAESLFIVLAFALPEPVVPVGLIITAVFGVLILLDLRFSIVAIAFITFFIHSETIGEKFIVQFAGVNLYAMDWIILFSACSGLYHSSSGGEHAVNGGAVRLPMVLFLISLPLFAAIGVLNGHTVKNAAADGRLFFYSVSFFIATAAVRGKADLALVFWSVMVLGTLGAIPQVLSSLTHSEIDRQTGNLLAFSRIRGANEANYPMLVAAAVVAYPFMDTYPRRLLVGAAGMVTALAMILSYTRGSWLAAALGLVVSMLMYGRRGNDRTRIFGILFGGAISGLVMLTVMDLAGVFTFRDLAARLELVSFSRVDISTLQRITEWVDAWGVFTRYPVFGAGLGYTYTFFAIGVGNLKQVYLHNSYLYVLSKMGVVGFILFLSVFLTALTVSQRTVKRMTHSPETGYYIALCTMLIVLMIKSFTTWHLNTLTTSIYVGVMLGVIGVYASVVRRSGELGAPDTR